MPQASVNGIQLEYDTHGDPSDPALLLIMGLGGQLIAWDDSGVGLLADQRLYVIRFDNRDAGLSTSIDTEAHPAKLIARLAAGESVTPPYTLTDMAADSIGLLDHLGIARTHLLGVSMGGMIAQHVAFEYPERTDSLTSVMSTTGAHHVGQPTPEGRAVLLAPSPLRREEVIEQGVAGARITHGPVHFDETLVRERLAAAFDRAFNPLGTSRQFLAVLTDGDRTQRLATITAPTLVIHGAADPLITPSGGEHTAAVIPGASLLMIEAMGHDIPQPLWPRVVEAVADHIRAAEAAQSR